MKRYLAARRFWQCILRRPFPLAYDFFQTRHVQRTREFGPLDVYSCSPLLFLQWAALKPNEIVWQRLLLSHHTNFGRLYFVWQLTAILPHYQDRLRVQGWLGEFLRMVGYPRPGPTHIKLSSQNEATRVRRWLQQVFRELQGTRPCWAQICNTQLTISVASPQTPRQNTILCPRVCRN